MTPETYTNIEREAALKVFKRMKHLFITYKKEFDTGFCRLLSCLTSKKKLLLKERYIIIVTMYSLYTRQEGNVPKLYWFKEGDYEVRLQWLNDTIEQLEQELKENV